ncbi:zinc ribbon domain-containing protein [Acinetobacter sp. 2JN-4]|uniref:zinc ribbon domain-containing protein n=1 Tax=Acinetobacter sp. 2JN-4 TaxID=2479844 RepID=UPI000EF9F8B4|nr:zinc ribbon domain-containing protein [Acinetobacter sp. 2JN-4]RLZ10283.1 zinc ribbon domain-containing protein [Acinetobacter sp. 2JN-4]
MIKVVDLKGDFFYIGDECVLSIRASIIGSKDDFGKLPYSIEEEVKILDSDGFEIDSVYLTFNPIKLNQPVFATETFTLDDQSQKGEIESINLLNKTVQISKSKDKANFEEFFNNQKISDWIPELKAKIKSDQDKTVISIKASICPQPNDEFYNRQEFYEEVKLLDEDGFQIASVPLHFRNTRAKQISSETVREELYDSCLSKKVKYIQLMDSIVCINPSQTISPELQIQDKKSSIDENSKIYLKGNIKDKSFCKECDAEIPFGVDICDECRAEKLKKIHGTATQKSSHISNKQISYCENCRCEVPFGAKICDFCRSQQLQRIHAGEKSSPTTNPVVQTRTPQSEWKPWPPKAQETIFQAKKEPHSIGMIGWIIIIFIAFFLLVTCFG